MSPVALKIEMITLGEKQVNRRLMRWSARAGNVLPAWGVIAEYLMRVETRQFQTEGQSSGHPWAQLSDATRLSKERKGLRPEILRARDKLFNALTVPGDQNQKIIMTKTSMVFGVKGEVAQYGEALMKQIPADGSRPRKPVDLTEGNRRACIKMVQLWITRGIARVAL
jgi:hypothetical protein